MTQHEIYEIAQNIIEEMGGDANEICSGECDIFAMKLVDRVGKGEIVSNLTAGMEDDFTSGDKKYTVIQPDEECSLRVPCARNYYSTSHCWVKIDGMFYDAFNPEGVDTENDLQFVQNA